VFQRTISSRTFFVSLLAIVLVAACVRIAFPTADPPWRTTVGVIWHDEGAWTHNARNRALFGEWVTDNWNPLYIAPVFTGLEFAAFRTFGVGLWQARSVSMRAGVAAVLLLGLAVRRMGGPAAGLVAAGLLATNYVWVMYSRAALMEAAMVAFMVASFYAWVRAERQPGWGWPLPPARCSPTSRRPRQCPSSPPWPSWPSRPSPKTGGRQLCGTGVACGRARGDAPRS
jgi:4-amino-4-deoxy-L-arabinose transferase-like glycosyltransferase